MKVFMKVFFLEHEKCMPTKQDNFILYMRELLLYYMYSGTPQHGPTNKEVS